jgi:hypothetical protein
LASRLKFKGSKKEKQTCAAALVGFFLWCWKQQIYAFFGSSYLLVQIMSSNKEIKEKRCGSESFSWVVCAEKGAGCLATRACSLLIELEHISHKFKPILDWSRLVFQ